jgi:hypothetical protein
MNATKKQEKIILDIYRELYKYSTPSADFDKLIENAIINEYGQKVIYFNDYEILDKDFDSILNKHLKKNRLSKLQQNMIRTTVILGCSPRTKITDKYE